MINWIDILSPKLRQLHRDWVHYRGTLLMPAVGDYNSFVRAPAAEAADDFAIAVLLPADGAPVFKHVGSGLAAVMPDCRSGMKFTDLKSPVLRTTVTQPFLRVGHSRQPEARRSRHDTTTAAARDHEMLLLPFSDSRLRVCIIHAVYDLAGIDWKRAFA